MNYYRSHKKQIGALIRLALIVSAFVIALAFPGEAGIGFAVIVVTPAIAKTDYKSWTVTALDADVALVFPHGFKQTAPTGNPSTGFTPDFCFLQELVSYANAALPNWGISVDATNITLAKTNAAGSGGAVPGTTVIGKIVAWRPHSLGE